MSMLPQVKQGVRVTYLSIIVNVLLAFLKCTLGFLGNSRALIADGVHSLLDLSTDTVALFGLKISSKPEDEDHLYGHHKFSSFSTLIISILIVFFCLGLCMSSIKSLFLDETNIPSAFALIAAGISILTKELLYWRTKFIAKKIKSKLLLANAWHHRTDSFSSVLVFVAIGGILLGGGSWAFLDSVMGLFLSMYLGFQAIKMGTIASNDLLDTAPEKHIINDIREHILPTPGAIAYHKFRVRPIGDLFEVDLHLQVAPNITVEKGHHIASQVKNNILKQHKEVLDVLVHIEPASPKHLKSQGIHEL